MNCSRLLLLAALAALPSMGGCRDVSAPASVTPPPPPAPDTSIGATPRILVIPTADGSGTVVHPDYVRMPSTWQGPSRFLAITTYPQADPNREWPSIFAQDSVNTRWHLLAGTPNPVLEPPLATTYTDPDVVYEPDSGELWMYARLVNAVWNVLQITKSKDGVHWTPAVDVDSARNHGMISPAVVRRGPGDWWLWSVHAPASGCEMAGFSYVELRRSTNGVAWATPDSVRIPGHPWHLDVQWIPDRNEWWALYVEGCLPTSVRLATSPDGITWTPFPSPVLIAGAIPEFKDVVYRSTFAVEGDSVRFWFSGARWDSTGDSTWVWHAAASVEPTAALLQRLSHVPAAAAPRTFIAARGVPYPEAP